MMVLASNLQIQQQQRTSNDMIPSVIQRQDAFLPSSKMYHRRVVLPGAAAGIRRRRRSLYGGYSYVTALLVALLLFATLSCFAHNKYIYLNRDDDDSFIPKRYLGVKQE
jgi:hypothetical protein